MWLWGETHTLRRPNRLPTLPIFASVRLVIAPNIGLRDNLP
jgi:hypothetical protein